MGNLVCSLVGCIVVVGSSVVVGCIVVVGSSVVLGGRVVSTAADTKQKDTEIEV